MSGAVHPAAPAEAALSAPTRRDGATRQHARIREVNVLSLLAIIVCTCAVTFLSTSTMLHVAFTCALFVLMAAMGFARAGAGFLLAFAVTHAWLALNVRFDIGFPSPMAFTFVLEMLPLLMPVYLLVQAPSGKLMASLRQLPIPSPVLLAVIVILRFMPTMLSELADVRDAMRTRGFLRSPAHVLAHPLATLEFGVVPMVFRSLTIAYELASSCIVRGIESPCAKQSYYAHGMRIGDGALMAGFAIASILIVVG